MSDKTKPNLYVRYLFPVGVLKNAAKGTMLERAAADRHNAAAVDVLVIYLWRWIVVSWLCIGAIYGLNALGAVALTVLAGIVGTVSVCIACVLGALSLFLRLK